MNLILLFEDDFIGERRVRLEGRRFDHLIKVHRARVGDRLSVGKLGGLTGTGIVISLEECAAEMEVMLEHRPPAPLPVTLILALPRPKFLRRILFSVSAMGVKRIIVLNSYRVEKSYWQSPFLKEDRIGNQLLLGLEQARDTIMPEVLLRPLFRPFVEDELPGMLRGVVPLLAQPGAQESCPRGISGQVALAVGPEGGFIPYEIERLVSCGFQAVSLGERVLHVEAAVHALLSRLF